MQAMDTNVMTEAGVVKRFGRKTVLDGLDWAVPRGSVVGLLGANGAGKTTLIKCLLGLLRPQAGECRIFGETSWTLSAEAKARIGYVAQVPYAYPWMTVGQWIRYTASFYPAWNDALIDRLAREWDVTMADRMGKLSPGQLQRAAILLALGHEPELLVLDEPAASLDPAARRDFLQVIVELAGRGDRTVLFSTHITSDLERVADRVAFLKGGRIVHFGLLDELKDRMQLNLEDSFLEMHRHV